MSTLQIRYSFIFHIFFCLFVCLFCCFSLYFQHSIQFFLYANCSFFFSIPTGIRQEAGFFHQMTGALFSSYYPFMTAFVMRLPVDRQCHCILSLLIMPYNASPDQDLPLLHWHFFLFVFSSLAASKNFSQQDTVLPRLIEHFTEKPTVYILRSTRKELIPLIVSSCCLTAPTDVSATKARSCFPFLLSLLCLHLANVSTCLMFFY